MAVDAIGFISHATRIYSMQPMGKLRECAQGTCRRSHRAYKKRGARNHPLTVCFPALPYKFQKFFLLAGWLFLHTQKQLLGAMPHAPPYL